MLTVWAHSPTLNQEENTDICAGGTGQGGVRGWLRLGQADDGH